jgi:hypothetical protein
MKSEKYELRLTVTNTPPIFKSHLENVEMHLNEYFEYTLPEIYDQENNPVEIIIQSAASFISLS